MKTISSMLVRIHSKVSNKQIAGKVLGAVLKKQYLWEEHTITSAEIFIWPLWPVYLKIHSSFTYKCARFHAQHRHHQLASCIEPGYLRRTVPFSDEDILCMMCSHAVAVLEEVYNDIVSGTITMKQLHELEEQKVRLFELCKAASSGKDRQYLAERIVNDAIKDHKFEYQKLTNRISLLTTPFLKVSSQVKVKGMFSTYCIFRVYFILCNILYLCPHL